MPQFSPLHYGESVKEKRAKVGLPPLRGDELPIYSFGETEPIGYVPGVTNPGFALNSQQAHQVYLDSMMQGGGRTASVEAAKESDYEDWLLTQFREKLAEAKSLDEVVNIVYKELYTTRIGTLREPLHEKFDIEIQHATNRILKEESETNLRDTKERQAKEEQERRKKHLADETARGVVEAILAANHEALLEGQRLEKAEIANNKKVAEQAKADDELYIQEQYDSGLPWAYPEDFATNKTVDITYVDPVSFGELRDAAKLSKGWWLYTVVSFVFILACVVTFTGLILGAPWWVFVASMIVKILSRWYMKANDDAN